MSQRSPDVTLVISRPGAGIELFTLRRPVTAIGSLPENDLILSGPFVSRRHARIEAAEDHVAIVDLNSTNGVELNRERLRPNTLRRLSHGDEITIAAYVLAFWEIDPLGGTQPLPSTSHAVARSVRLEVQGLEVDSAAGVVRFDGEPLLIRWSRLELRLLVHLYEHAGLICTRDQLGEAVWGTAEVGGRKVPLNDENMLYARIHAIKSKLRSAGISDQHIVSLPGIGYRFDPILGGLFSANAPISRP